MPQHPAGAAWPLAHNPRIGCIFRCPDCDQIHLVLGSTNLQVNPDTFLEVVDLISRAAANFESMLEAHREDRCA
jgi:hypothetical protein